MVTRLVIGSTAAAIAALVGVSGASAFDNHGGRAGGHMGRAPMAGGGARMGGGAHMGSGYGGQVSGGYAGHVGSGWQTGRAGARQFASAGRTAGFVTANHAAAGRRSARGYRVYGQGYGHSGYRPGAAVGLGSWGRGGWGYPGYADSDFGYGWGYPGYAYGTDDEYGYPGYAYSWGPNTCTCGGVAVGTAGAW